MTIAIWYFLLVSACSSTVVGPFKSLTECEAYRIAAFTYARPCWGVKR